MSGEDTRSSVKCGQGPGLTVAAVARRCGGRWDLVAFRCCGDRGVGDSIHYGRCSGLEGYMSVTLYTGHERERRRTRQWSSWNMAIPEIFGATSGC